MLQTNHAAKPLPIRDSQPMRRTDAPASPPAPAQIAAQCAHAAVGSVLALQAAGAGGTLSAWLSAGQAKIVVRVQTARCGPYLPAPPVLERRPAVAGSVRAQTAGPAIAAPVPRP